MGFNSVRDYIESATTAGKYWEGTWRRTAPALSTTMWSDMSYGGGGPPANYYASAPGVWAQLAESDGIFHGPSVSPSTKHLKRILAVPGSGCGVTRLMLLDYLMYCPFYDGDSTDEQTATWPGLPRHTDGRNLNIMLVSQGAGGGLSPFVVRYLNDKNVERTTTMDMNSGVFTGSAGTTLQGQDGSSGLYAGLPFVKLYPGDGIKELRGIQLQSASGGVFAAVIVNVIASISNKDNLVQPYEVDYIDHVEMPVVADNAVLHFIGRSTTAAAPAHIAQLEFVWS